MVNVAKLRGKIAEKGWTYEQLSEAIKMDRSTLYRRFKNSDEFTVGEAKAISTALELTAEEIEAIFFSQVVA